MLRGRRCDVSPTASCSKMVFIHAHNKPRCNLGNLSQKWYLSNVDLNNSFPVAILCVRNAAAMCDQISFSQER
jgi:hypothetical protein